MASPVAATATESEREQSTGNSASNAKSKKERPCDACRKRKSRCVMKEGARICVLCEFHRQECTFLQTPLPRKRKLWAEGVEEKPNRRYVSGGGVFSDLKLCDISEESTDMVQMEVIIEVPRGGVLTTGGPLCDYNRLW